MNSCEGESAWNRVVSNAQGGLCCCRRVKLGEEHAQLWVLLTLAPTSQSISPSPCSSSCSFPHKTSTKPVRLFFHHRVFGSHGPCIRNLAGKTSGFAGSLSCGGNISGLAPAVQLVNKQECEFPGTFIADGPLLLAPVVP